MKLCALIAACSIGIASASDNSPAEVLKRVTAKVLAREAALPNYTCVETVTRDYYQSTSTPKSCAALMPPQQRSAAGLPALPPALWIMTDRLRLDVAITQRGEIYSWVGASKFEDGSIDEIVKQGPFGTGSFGALLAIIFKQDPKTFRFKRYSLDNGRTLMEYSFEVSQEESRYQVKAGDSWIHSAYSGTFQADQETDEVVRVTLQSAEFRPETGSCWDSTMMDLKVTRIGNGQFPLPTGAWQRFVARNGETVENTTSLSSCREYLGESTISFSDAPELAGGNNRKMAPPRVQLPAGLAFTLELTTPLSTNTAAAGDPFAARIVNALRDKQGKTLAPAHALVEGRVVVMEIRQTVPPGAVLILKPMTIEIGGIKTPLTAVRRAGLTPRGKEPIQLPLSWERNSGIFPLSGEHAEIKAGFRSDWQTMASDTSPVSK